MPNARPWDADRAGDIIDVHLGLEGPALPILHALQEAFGCVPAPAVALMAERLNVSRAEMHGVVTFYHDFHEEPAGRHVIRVCRAESCQARGSRSIEETFRNLLGLDWHQTSADGRVTLEPVYCLGLCACAPAAMIDGRVVGRVDAARMARILSEAGA